MNNIVKLAKTTGSFLEGFASIIDLSHQSHRYNYKDTPKEADQTALASDWEAIGEDIQFAISHYDEKK